MRSFTLVTLSLFAARLAAVTITVSPDDDFEAVCLKEVQPGDTCILESGDHLHDGLTVTHGTENARITITGESGACIKGSNTQDRALQIAHDYYTIKDLCFNGEHGDENVATAIYVLGADWKSTLNKNGVEIKSSVTGLQMFDLDIRNFGSECVHFRYSVTWAEVQGCTIQHCGIEAFENGEGGKVGEAIYMGTALDQVDDNKAPEIKLREGSADNVDADNCGYNWIHHNTIRTYGNECVDVKEGSANNLIEHNICEQQQDPNSGCFGLRGSDNTVRWNDIAECKGAGVRVGGDRSFGTNNNIYGNNIKNADAGAFSVHSPDQGTVCENNISGVDKIVFGTEKDQPQFTEEVATGECDSYPGDLGLGSTIPSPSPSDDGDSSSSSDLTDDDSIQAGINYTDEALETEPEVLTIGTNSAAGSNGQGECPTVLKVEKVSVKHAFYADSTTEVDNLFDADLATYYSINRESTQITLQLEEETEVVGVAISFFMKLASEERIYTFDIGIKDADADEWTTVISRKESSGEKDVVETFPFSSRKAFYVRFESHGNTFNNWTAISEFEVCGTSAEESNAIFGGVEAALGHELQTITGAICTNPAKVAPHSVRASGNGDVRTMFDKNFDTRWSTTNTHNASDLDNDMVQLTFAGDIRVSTLKIAFFDGHLASQHFSVYRQKASANTWTPVMVGAVAERTQTLQEFSIESDFVNMLYIVGNGNDIGFYTKIAEIEVMGC